MREGRTSTDMVALKHPLWWGALVVLVINDHWLKGAGLVPDWATGKLSDFAGLIVAPVLVSALFAARSRRARGLAFLLVGGWFTAANLVAPVAEATSVVGSWFGLSWSFWVDSTDLVALAALPVAWQVASHRSEASPRRVAEGLVAGLGIAACVASPQMPPRYQTAAFLVNDTGSPQQVRVRWIEARVDCGEVRERPAETMARSAFESGTTFNLDIDEILPLDRGLASGDAGFGIEAETGHIGTCDVAIVSASGLPEQLVYWEGLETITVPVIVQDRDAQEEVQEGLQLRADASGESLSLVPPASHYVVEATQDLYDGGASCRDYGSTSGFDWSELPPWEGELVRLVEVHPTIDECVELSMEEVLSGTRLTAFLCVPPEDFPFHSNAEVRIWAGEHRLRIIRDLELDDGTLWRTGELAVSRGLGVFDEGPFRVELMTVDADCQGVRMECGGFRVPAAGGLRSESGTRFVHPGEAVERDAPDGRRARLRVGRAESLWVAHASCGGGRDLLGPRLEALVVYGEEAR